MQSFRIVIQFDVIYDCATRFLKAGDVKKFRKNFLNIPEDIGFDGFQLSLCRNIHQNFCKTEGKTHQDRTKMPESRPIYLRGCKKLVFYSPSMGIQNKSTLDVGIPLGAHRHILDGTAHHFFNGQHIVLGCFRQIFKFTGT